MRFPAILAALVAATFVVASPHHAQLYYQLVTASGSPKPMRLAEVQFDPTTPESATVLSYDAPDLLFEADAETETNADLDANLVRIGLYDSKKSTWISSTSVTSASTFSKGYSPHLLLTVDTDGTVLGAAARGVRIDAGVTRDFGPQAIVHVTGKGKTPEAGKPVVLTPDGKKHVPEQEKSFLQKYWWVLAVLAVLTLGGGGGDGK
ncbi:hypothetical protein SODALDRAFT_321672 [Sodiomyces alkalinus F11]|uniref:Cyclin-dependent protein kinase regulator pho80 n=1 Tax=Sodiomyces alkalinus (strain CBS 110278 / VKM F-3762 / F11) TaxID=1314773 RepID=A0A3N2Q0K7_SODAK|nr:hypothetical protein SODALDRAFT_321672 [Sodiomyces alkalinus F11]ROT40297.1 hypothetical protein SODALDRAFT_321672 [Sodiomyces alkalinus F11]